MTAISKASHQSSCQKMGHIEKYCRAKQAQYQQPRQHEANFIDDQEKRHQRMDHLFMACHSPADSGKDGWFIDSGCTSQIYSLSWTSQ